MTPMRRSQNWLPYVFNDLFDNDWMIKANSTAPAINVIESEKDYRVEVAAPGMTKDDFNIRIDEKDRIWVTVLGVGFVRLTLSEDKCSVAEARNYDLAAGTDGNVFSTRIDQELILCCDDRAYRIDYVTDSLVRAPGAEQILGLCGRGG